MQLTAISNLFSLTLRLSTLVTNNFYDRHLSTLFYTLISIWLRITAYTENKNNTKQQPVAHASNHLSFPFSFVSFSVDSFKTKDHWDWADSGELKRILEARNILVRCGSFLKICFCGDAINALQVLLLFASGKEL